MSERIPSQEELEALAGFKKGDFVRIGNGEKTWCVLQVCADGNTILRAARRNDDGTFQRSRHIPGQITRKTTQTAKLSKLNS
ncbi:hypothetical protein ACTXJU_15675 [Glutamicibacter ardleyensis]|uniref:hypothetical protein n=1 Tax=Glutamicibacter ardleyensis TaxID=225894 RepID=UPI003FD3F0DA